VESYASHGLPMGFTKFAFRKVGRWGSWWRYI